MPSPRKKNSSNGEFEEFVKQVSGDNGLRIVNSIGDGATDEKIEKETKLKLSEIRAALNVLQNYGVVEYNREKNMSSGWFTYTWRINASRALQNKLTKTRNEYAALRKESAEDGAVVYKCPGGCERLLFDRAVDANFQCPKCSKKLKFADGTVEMRLLQTKISALEQILQSALAEPSNKLF